MKVLHVIPSLSLKHGGPSVALPLMARSLVAEGVSVDIATTDDDGPRARMAVPLGARVERDGYGVYYFRKQTEFYKASWPFARWVKAHVADYDLLHIHALFSYTSTCAAGAARKAGVPYVIRPLGVLNRWGMANRRQALKALSFRWVEQPILRHAAAIHYTSRAEKAEAEEVGARAPAAIIPLGLDLQECGTLPGPAAFWARCPEAQGREVILFLSRIDPKKGLDLLLPAFAMVCRQHPRALLVVAGKGDAAYQATLQAQAKQLGVERAVLWPGFLTGDDKRAALAAATVYVLPSHSENFGIALVEAMAAGLACLTTPGVAVSEDIAEHEAGLVTEAEPARIAEGLSKLLADEALRHKLGANTARLARERFSLESMGQALAVLYKTIISPR